MRKGRGSTIFGMLLCLMICFSLVSCASDIPWRKATVATFELVGVGVGATRDTAEALRVKNVISEDQILKIKDIYNKAQKSYAAAGNALKLAGRVVSTTERDASLAEYVKLLSDFKTLTIQLYDLIKGFKKVSYNEVLEAVRDGKLNFIVEP
jgi:hypothetical protein